MHHSSAVDGPGKPSLTFQMICLFALSSHFEVPYKLIGSMVCVAFHAEFLFLFLYDHHRLPCAISKVPATWGDVAWAHWARLGPNTGLDICTVKKPARLACIKCPSTLPCFAGRSDKAETVQNTDPLEAIPKLVNDVIPMRSSHVNVMPIHSGLIYIYIYV